MNTDTTPGISLTTKAWVSLVLMAIVMGLLIFVPAGTTNYWQAWVFLAVFFLAGALHTGYAIRHDPALLKRRMSGGPTAEKEMAQKIIMLFATIGFIGMLLLPALDRRFGWSAGVPVVLVIAGDLLIAVGFYMISFVFRANSFAAATIQVEEGQKVITTGPYAIVRHPMYSGALLYCIGIPLALGSYWGFAPLAMMFGFIIWRLFDEERLLRKNLPGYAEYCAKVKWRLVPGVF